MYSANLSYSYRRLPVKRNEELGRVIMPVMLVEYDKYVVLVPGRHAIAIRA